jgi:RNA polymerase primary sigma factor
MYFKLRKNAGQQSLDEWSFDPTEEVGSNELELNAFGVDVSAVDRGGYGLGTGAPDGHSNGWALDDEVAAVPIAEGTTGLPRPEVDNPYGGDLLNRYIREMGIVALLTREDESRLAGAIEQGIRESIEAICECPSALAELMCLVERVGSGELRVSDFVASAPEVTAPESALVTEASGSDLRQHRQTEAYFEGLRALHERLTRAAAQGDHDSPDAQAVRGHLVDALLALRILPVHIARLRAHVQRFAHEAQRLRRLILRRHQRAELASDPSRALPRHAETVGEWAARPHQASSATPDPALQDAEVRLARVEIESGLDLASLEDIHQRLRKSELKARQAKDRMVSANLRLVISIAKKYRQHGLPFLDLIQEGNLGLMKAVDKFEHRRGLKFSTYAHWWIRQAITRAISEKAREIRVPVHVLERISKVRRASREIARETGREPLPEEIAARTQLSEEAIGDLLDAARQPVSMDSPIRPGVEFELRDVLADDHRQSPLDSAAAVGLTQEARSMLDVLTPREAKVVAMRFGIGLSGACTLEEVGKQMHLSRERIRQIEAEALTKLRNDERSAHLRSYLGLVLE